MYIIGDIHGCFLTLQKLVEKIGKNEVFYSVGDIVDKGPDACKTLDFVMSLKNFKIIFQEPSNLSKIVIIFQH